MSQNQIVAFQSALIFLQMVNAQIAIVTKSQLVALIVGSFLGGFQYWVQHLGNASLSPENQTAMQNAGVQPRPPQDGVDQQIVPPVVADVKASGGLVAAVPVAPTPAAAKPAAKW